MEREPGGQNINSMPSHLSEVDMLERRIAKLTALVEVGRAFSQELALDTLLQLVMQKTTEILGADRSTLFLVDYKTRELWSKIAQGVGLAEIRFPMHLGLAGHVATTGETVNIPEAYEDPRFNREVDRRTDYRTRTILCAPVREENKQIIGVTQVLNKRDGTFTAEDEDMLQALSSQAAIALKNAQLFEQVSFMKNYNESILRSMATGVVTLGSDGRVTTLNPAALRIFGLQNLDWQGLAVAELLNAPRNASLVEAVEGCVTTGEEYTGYELKYTTLAGDQVSLNVHALPLRDAKGQALGGIKQKVTVLFFDIRSYTTLTERSTAEEVVALLNDYPRCRKAPSFQGGDRRH